MFPEQVYDEHVFYEQTFARDREQLLAPASERVFARGGSHLLAIASSDGRTGVRSRHPPVCLQSRAAGRAWLTFHWATRHHAGRRRVTNVTLTDRAICRHMDGMHPATFNHQLANYFASARVVHDNGNQVTFALPFGGSVIANRQEMTLHSFARSY